MHSPQDFGIFLFLFPFWHPTSTPWISTFRRTGAFFLLLFNRQIPTHFSVWLKCWMSSNFQFFSRKTKTSFYANLYHITFMSMTSFVCLDSFLLPLPILMDKHCIPIVGSLFPSLLMVSMLQFMTVKWMEVRSKLLPL